MIYTTETGYKFSIEDKRGTYIITALSKNTPIEEILAVSYIFCLRGQKIIENKA
jgi:hypothetical protein